MKIFLGILIIIFVLIIVFTIIKKRNNQNTEFSIYFFNAGKADCILISNNDKYVLIDTGEQELGSTILQYLKNNGISKLDYLIITHFDKDHVGSAAAVIDNIEIENVLQSNMPKESEYYDNYIESLSKKNITPQTIAGDEKIVLGDLNIIVNGPTTTYEKNESNNSSLIVSVNYKNTNYLFAGDAQNDRIEDYLVEHVDTYDFIKIPYHGNYQKKLDDLLNVVKAKYAVITCSDEEPEEEKMIEVLNKYNLTYYLTRKGSITVTSDGNNITIKQ